MHNLLENCMMELTFPEYLKHPSHALLSVRKIRKLMTFQYIFNFWKKLQDGLTLFWPQAFECLKHLKIVILLFHLCWEGSKAPNVRDWYMICASKKIFVINLVFLAINT